MRVNPAAPGTEKVAVRQAALKERQLDSEVRRPAEAEAMNARAEAFARYNEAAVLEMLVEVLPKVAREVAAPMAAIDKLTVISTDGAAALPRQVVENLVQTMELLKNTTGIDLDSLVQRYAHPKAPQSDHPSPQHP